MSSIRPQRAPFRLADLGVYGFDRHETTILASLVTEDPLLLVGRSGTGKTFLLNTLSEALGLEHRHYNASLISFDDLVGFPVSRRGAHHRALPRDAGHRVGRGVGAHRRDLALQARAPEPALLAGARAQAAGPAARATALSLGRDEPVHVGPGRHRGLLGLRAARPRARGPLCAVVTAADWSDLTNAQQQAIVAPSGEGDGHAAQRRAVRCGRPLARAVHRTGERVPAAGHHLRHDGRQRAERRLHPHLAATGAAARPQPRRRDHRRGPRDVGHLQERARVQPAALDVGPVGRSRGRRGRASRRLGRLARGGGRLDPRVPRRAEPAAQALAAARQLRRPGRGLAGRSRSSSPTNPPTAPPRSRSRRTPPRSSGRAADRRRGRERPREARRAAARRRGRALVAGAAEREGHQPPGDREHRPGAGSAQGHPPRAGAAIPHGLRGARHRAPVAGRARAAAATSA